jgi:hypothetical protein
VQHSTAQQSGIWGSCTAKNIPGLCYIHLPYDSPEKAHNGSEVKQNAAA